MIRLIMLSVFTASVVWAQSSQQEKLNVEMCGSGVYRFDKISKECIYCAHGLVYDKDLKCMGTPSVLGKCYGNHHYHAATMECMFCATGYTFDKESRQCTSARK